MEKDKRKASKESWPGLVVVVENNCGARTNLFFFVKLVAQLFLSIC